jgi:hypothetical protein
MSAFANTTNGEPVDGGLAMPIRPAPPYRKKRKEEVLAAAKSPYIPPSPNSQTGGRGFLLLFFVFFGIPYASSKGYNFPNDSPSCSGVNHVTRDFPN